MNKCQWVYQVRKKRLTNGSCLNQIFHKPYLKSNSINKLIEGVKKRVDKCQSSKSDIS